MLSNRLLKYTVTSRSSSSIRLCYELNEDQRQFQTSLRSFVKQEIIPKASEYDQSMAFPWPIIQKTHEMGFLNAEIPQQYGGMGMSVIDNVLIHEEIAYGCSGVGIAVMCNTLPQTPLVLFGSEDIKKRFLTRMTEEPLMAAYAVTEPSAGSDVAGGKMKCEKKGDEFILNGSKMWITNGGPANWFFVLARSDPDPQCPPGKAFTAFVVEGNTPGITRGKKEINMGQRCSDTRAITFEEVRVPVNNVVGSVGEGFKVAMRTFDKTRPLVAALATGLSARCVDEATNYAMQRKTFGTEISNHQAIQIILADMCTNLEMARMMTYRSANEIDNGSMDGTYFSSMAKIFSTDTAMRAASNCVQVFGGAGYNVEYPAEKLMRDAKILQIYGGTSQIQRTIISRQHLNRVRRSSRQQ